MLKRVAHTGFVVNNIDDSIAFYRDVIGLELVMDIIIQGTTLYDKK